MTIQTLVIAFNYLVLAYFVALNGVYLIMSVVAFRTLRRYAIRLKTLDLNDLISSAGAPPITLISPAYNEEHTCVDATRALLTLDYPEVDILIVNDGSTDGTMDRLHEAFELQPAVRSPTADLETAPIEKMYQSRAHPNLWVLDKQNGGKADALNAGMNYCNTPLFCTMDADSLIERDALTRIVRPFLEDATTIAVGGIVRIANGCEVDHGAVRRVRLPLNILAQFQVLEYLRSFLSGRMGWSEIRATLIISGAFGLFSRSVVVGAGGYASRFTSGETVGEDMELIVRLDRYCQDRKIPYRIAFVPDPVAWTECPETLRQLGRQRDRWQRGLGQSLWRHRGMLLNPKYGRVGLLAFPYYFFLELLGPMVEMTGYFVFAVSVGFQWVTSAYVVAFFLVAIVMGSALSVAAVALEELTFRRYPNVRDLLRLFLLAAVENFGYRQITTYWRAKGLLTMWFRATSWGRMDRRGFKRAERETQPLEAPSH